MDRQFFEIDSDLFRLSPQPIWIYNLETLEIIDFNNAACNKFGYKLQEVQGRLITEFRPPYDDDRFKKKLGKIQKRSPYERTNQAIEFNGRRVWVETEFHRLKVSETEDAEMVVVERDISTERYDRILNETKSEIIEQLALSQDLGSILQRIAQMFTAGRDDIAVAVLDHDSVRKRFNVVAKDHLSSKYDQSINQLEYESIKNYLDLIRKNASTENDDEFTFVQFPISKSYPKYRLIPIEGSHFLFGAIILYGNDELVLSHLNTKLLREAKNLLRVTLKKAFHKKQLKDNETRFQAALRSMPIYVARLDTNGRHEWFASKYFDLDTDQLIGNTLEEVYGSEHSFVKKFEKQIAEVIESGEPKVGRYEFSPSDRSLITGQEKTSRKFVRSSIVPSVNDSGQIEGLYHCGYDITDTIEHEERLTKALEERNTLLAEIHHRVKNNLAVIDSLLALQRMEIKSEEAEEVIAFSQSRVQAMKHVHENLYNHELLTEVKIDKFLHHHVHQMKGRHEEMGKEVIVNCEEITLNLTQAVPYALAVNELLMLFCEKFCQQFVSNKISITTKSRENKVITNFEIMNPEKLPDRPIQEHVNLELLDTVLGMINGDIDFEINGKLEAIVSFQLN